MLACPACAHRLRRDQDQGVVHRCDRCGGVSMTVALVRRRGVDPGAVARLWNAVRGGPEDPARACPHCRRAMRQAPSVNEWGDTFAIDGCTACHALWFDHGELESLPVAPERADPDELPEEARRILAEAKLQKVREAAADEAPVSAWQWVPMMLGMPAELESRPLSRLPLVTWTLAALMLVVGLSVEAGILFAISNAYFLAVFGDNVEDLLGHARYALLVAGSVGVGHIAHALLDPGGALPLFGASGGVFGVLAFYAVAFPRARVGFLVYFRLLRAPVLAMLVVYALLQLLGAYLQAGGFRAGVPYLAQVGGAAVGVGSGLWMRRPAGSATR